jgi:hypothetical protein
MDINADLGAAGNVSFSCLKAGVRRSGLLPVPTRFSIDHDLPLKVGAASWISQPGGASLPTTNPVVDSVG